MARGDPADVRHLGCACDRLVGDEADAVPHEGAGRGTDDERGLVDASTGLDVEGEEVELALGDLHAAADQVGEADPALPLAGRCCLASAQIGHRGPLAGAAPPQVAHSPGPVSIAIPMSTCTACGHNG
ncbi:hypothetical protein [Mariniluteicoccus endophyticus]